MNDCSECNAKERLIDYLYDKIDELEAEIFRLREENSELQFMREGLEK